jgi:hypothetical protein
MVFNLGYGKTSYINPNETQEALEHSPSSDSHTHEDPSSVISLIVTTTLIIEKVSKVKLSP